MTQFIASKRVNLDLSWYCQLVEEVHSLSKRETWKEHFVFFFFFVNQPLLNLRHGRGSHVTSNSLSAKHFILCPPLAAYLFFSEVLKCLWWSFYLCLVTEITEKTYFLSHAPLGLFSHADSFCCSGVTHRAPGFLLPPKKHWNFLMNNFLNTIFESLFVSFIVPGFLVQLNDYLR